MIQIYIYIYLNIIKKIQKFNGPGEPFILHMKMVSTKSAKINRAYYDHKMGKMKIN